MRKLASKVLTIGRRFHFERVYQVTSKMYPEAKCELWSDENLGGDRVHWWGKYFYPAYRQMKDGRANPFSAEELDDIIERCRFIREFPRDEAELMAGAGFYAWQEIIEKYGYDCVCSLPLDAFTFDTLAHAADRAGIPDITACWSTVSGHIRWTLRGTSLGRLPEEDVDRKAFEEMCTALGQPAYQPAWLFGTKSTVAKNSFRRLMIDMAKPLPFWAYRTFKGDPLSFSFSPYRLQNRLMFASPARFRASVEMEKRASTDLPKEYALIPLQFYPESSTDYWIPERPVINHYKTVLAIVDGFAGKLPVVIKEHPVCVGRRNEDFFKELCERDNVHFAKLLHPMGDLVNRATVVVGHGSSTMLQGMVMGKRQFFIGTPYYGSGGKPVLRSLESSHVTSVIDSALNDPIPGSDVARELLWDFYCRLAPSSLGQSQPIGEKTLGSAGAPNITPLGRKLLESAHDELASGKVALHV